MPKRKDILTDKIRPYHISSRSLDGRLVFDAPEDRARFVFQVYAANVGKPALNVYRKNIFEVSDALLQGEPIPPGFLVEEHDPLVEIFSFSISKDRYHFGLVPTSKESIPQYMQKLNLGFAKFYNLKYKRTGALFEGRFKASPITSPQQLSNVVKYINIKKGLDMYDPKWKESGIYTTPDPYRFVSEYAFSSFQDLFGIRESLLLTPEGKSTLRKLLGEGFFAKREEYADYMEEFIEKQTKENKKLYLE